MAVALTTKTGGEPAAASSPVRRKPQPESPGRLMSSSTMVGRKPERIAPVASSEEPTTRVSWPRALRCLDTAAASGWSSSISRTRALGVFLFIYPPHDQVAARVLRPQDRFDPYALIGCIGLESLCDLLSEAQARQSDSRGRPRRDERDGA